MVRRSMPPCQKYCVALVTTLIRLPGHAGQCQVEGNSIFVGISVCRKPANPWHRFFEFFDTPTFCNFQNELYGLKLLW